MHDAAGPHATSTPALLARAGAVQAPVLPQRAVRRALGGSARVVWRRRAGAGCALTLQDWQAAQVAVAQQTPLAQLPPAHSFAAPQAAPFAFLATQLPGVVALPVQ